MLEQCYKYNELEETALTRKQCRKEFCLVRENIFTSYFKGREEDGAPRNTLDTTLLPKEDACLQSGPEAATAMLLCPFQLQTQCLSK